MKRKAVTVSTVNSAIARAGIKAELVRGNGYHYFQGREVIHRHPGPVIHRGHQENLMDLRFCFVDSETGEGCTVDLQITALNALAIADAMNQVDGAEEENLVGVFMEMHGTSCAVVLRNDRYIMTGIGYTVFDRDHIPADYHGSQLRAAPTRGERLAPSCSCGHSIESNRCTCD